MREHNILTKDHYELTFCEKRKKEVLEMQSSKKSSISMKMVAVGIMILFAAGL